MANFKKHSFKIEDKKIEVWIKVNEKGKFYYELPTYVLQALGYAVNETSELFDAADKAGYSLHDNMRAYKELFTTHSYHIKYRFAFSKRIKSQIPNEVLPNNIDDIKKVSRIGSEYFPEDALSFILNWFPMEKTVHGERIIQSRLEPADEYDIKMAEEHGSVWLDNLHKPYEGIILKHDKQHWNDNDDKYFEIPLTKETYEFFVAFEENFIKMISGLFKFFNKDERQLMQAITKMLSSGDLKMLTE